MKEREILKIFGWPDASWLRGYNEVVKEIKRKDKRGTTQKTMCSAIQSVIGGERDIAVQKLKSNNFELAHAFTNELLELIKMYRSSCEPSTTAALIERGTPPPPILPTPSQLEPSLPPIVAPVEVTAKRDLSDVPEIESFDEEEVLKKAEGEAPAKKARPSGAESLFTREERTKIERFLEPKKLSEWRPSMAAIVERVLERPTELVEPSIKVEESVIPRVPSKLVDQPTLVEIDRMTNEMKRASDTLNNFDSKIQDRPATQEEAAHHYELLSDLGGKVLATLVFYEKLHNDGYVLPRGYNEGNRFRKELFESRIRKATKTLSDTPPSDDYPDASLDSVNDDIVRRALIEVLSEFVH